MKKILVALVCLLVLGACSKTQRQTVPDEPAASAPTRHIQGGNGKPIAVPAATPTSGGVPLTVHFMDGGSYDPEGDSIISWEWNFADEEEGQGGWHDYTETEGDAWHTYTVAGVYTAHLRVTDSEGKKDIAHIQITLADGLNANPIAIANVGPVSGSTPLKVTFSAASSYDPDGSIVKWEWDLGDGIFLDFTGTQGEMVHTYTSVGTYTTLLRITDDENAVGTQSSMITAPTWAHTWGGPLSDGAGAVAVGINGNICTTGGTSSFGAGGSDVLVLNYSSDGQLLWVKTWGTPSADEGGDIAIDTEGNIYVVGRCVIGGDVNVVILKYSPSGDLLWQRMWSNNNSRDEGYAIALDESGSIYIAGVTRVLGSDDENAFLVRISPAGDLLWQRIWGGAGNDRAFGIAVDANNRIVVVGRTWSFGAGQDDAFVVVCSPSGDFLWQKTWGGSISDLATAVTVDPSGDIYAVGYTTSFGRNYYENEAFLVKYSPSGDLVWQRTWGMAGDDYAHGVTIESGGNVLVAGNVGGSISLSTYSQLGNMLSHQIWYGEWGSQALGIMSTPDGQVYLVGRASDAYGQFSTLDAVVGNTPSGAETVPAEILAIPTGTVDIPNGIENTPVGVEDEFTSVSSALLIRFP
ncbi:MAG: hypothetical protein VE98_C0001G0382 [candidate division Kazan bacterium GW2011_GWA1_50_15]|uniref:Putiative protein kinase 1 n=2 Tax=Bacteria division Kazan-3B-28 TaxID=1798534 RepID=A0A0G1X6V2_UNCK3|nr:MAG: hypothetical protein VE98_C0001G0382 [candidate division Kazan bacterium GW2011_GWA1_50_15]KKW25926.1 MAG: putiative protein kinase 1 [candidate division Kazan bacterium GW2011_GWC1_52_13]KKW26580.1 MAG: putiative protein kinase 1 [candidate division Kazan bacterium GW2011_GWB1_52_7]HCR42627.1 hypothetical protein [Patescibacteria group bacterium]